MTRMAKERVGGDRLAGLGSVAEGMIMPSPAKQPQDEQDKQGAELRILTPVGMLGYGFPLEDFWAGIDAGADAIVIDSGSTDNGPQELALGKRTNSGEAYRRDLEPMIEAAATRRIPVLIGSAGGTGTNAQVDYLVDVVRSIAQERGHRLKIAAIYADIPDAIVRGALADGRIGPCGPVPLLTEEDVDDAAAIVAQMGAEPFLRVFEEQPDVDVIVAGRAYDPAPYAALCMRRGISPGVAWHMGKIMECGAVCAEPKGRVILATVRRDSFDLVPMNPGERCTPLSVAAHTLYEKSRADLLAGPGGLLDLSEATYEALDERTVRVRHSVFRPTVPYTIKLEGAKIVGHHAIFIGGVRDSILIAQVDAYLSSVRAYAASLNPSLRDGLSSLHFHVYGKNGVMGPLEPIKDAKPHELGILCEATGPTQATADAICNTARVAALHAPYPGQLATGGNMAFPLTPMEIPIGPVCAFNVYHLMEVDDPIAPFPIRYTEV